MQDARSCIEKQTAENAEKAQSAPRKSNSLKVMILTSSTGGGHDMRANAFKAWTETDAGKALHLEIDIQRPLESTSRLYRFGVGLYNTIQRRAPFLHHIYYVFLEYAAVSSKSWKIPGRRRFMETVRSYEPDILLSTHDHLNHGFFQLATSACPQHPPLCVTYCGELFGGYGFSRWWVSPDADLFIGAVEETCVEARRLGLDENRVWEGGFLLYPSFYEPPISEQARERFIEQALGLDPGRFIVLLSTGANAANNHLRLLNALKKTQTSPQVIALCGRNQDIRRRVDRFAQAHPDMPVRALGYTSEMSKLMACADTIVARPGTGVTSEAIHMGCPLLFNGLGGIMPQEIITLRYCEEHGVGLVFRSPAQFAAQMRKMIDDPAGLDEMKRKQRALRPKRTPPDIMKKILSLARE